ncbi:MULTISPECIES: tetratricopeptide repeat protein [Thermomonospora]|uniref:Thioredoxin domain protein n=1 Tax=Thermomonospora curvata (strain ATCC 19995 / DSM 43183 / JCM 3096 / KCTC 9072 / NBRC 15933 / NCIMB 10081 / Henssen B9) TaxID=471852 RepID=D1ADY9_THECD|nr:MULTISPECIES: tetratricopeptide repeat protein [Thermomonospora]ACY99415.1 Thioredoxin domain protein [Thermomonospora curvata DSM 43183]PKK12462.1 MAG: co-chaperone YbbN [Thermomonospora sp. CIF 1]
MASRDFSIRGAIDLGARQAALKKQQEQAARAAQTSGNGPGAAGGYVVDVTDATFNTEVVERSRSVPVLVDFWAEWCGPCKQLGPILERLAEEAAGQWILAKVDIDANPQLAAYMQQMGVRGIPFVAAVVGGRLMPLLPGAYPEPQVRQIIGQFMDALRREGMLPQGGPGAGAQPEPDPVYAKAQEALQRGDLEAAKTAFQEILNSSPQDAGAKRGLAEVELHLRARQLDPGRALAEADAAPADVALQTKAADVEMLSGRVEEAFERLVATVRRTAGEDRDAARKHLLSLFEVLPPDDPRVSQARRRLQTALF